MRLVVLKWEERVECPARQMLTRCLLYLIVDMILGNLNVQIILQII